jgi:hypothetical protein
MLRQDTLTLSKNYYSWGVNTAINLGVEYEFYFNANSTVIYL